MLKLMIAVIADAYGKEIDIIEAKHKEKQEKRLLRRQARITKKILKKDKKRLLDKLKLGPSLFVSDNGRGNVLTPPSTSTNVRIFSLYSVNLFADSSRMIFSQMQPLKLHIQMEHPAHRSRQELTSILLIEFPFHSPPCTEENRPAG